MILMLETNDSYYIWDQSLMLGFLNIFNHDLSLTIMMYFYAAYLKDTTAAL